MHMANELLSAPVAAGTVAIAAGAVGYICHKARDIVTSDSFALMGVMGAFVFAAQMVNFQLPLMPGTSGHLVGAVLLAIILGPVAGAIVLTSVIIVQCLIFQDGGLLALGCNIINMAIVPCFLGRWIYDVAAGSQSGKGRTYAASVIACVVAVGAGAILVVIEAGLSGVVVVPVRTFMVTMIGIHVVIGLMEGVITAGVLLYLREVHARVFGEWALQSRGTGRKALYVTLAVVSLVVGAGLSLVASDRPDGLEWSYADRPDQPGFEKVVSNDSAIVAAVDKAQSKYSPLPDYSIRSESDTTKQTGESVRAGWTSFAGVLGSGVTMLVVWLSGAAVKRRNGSG